MKKPSLGIELQIEDFVHHFHNVLIRKVTISNLSQREKEVEGEINDIKMSSEEYNSLSSDGKMYTDLID